MKNPCAFSSLKKKKRGLKVNFGVRGTNRCFFGSLPVSSQGGRGGGDYHTKMTGVLFVPFRGKKAGVQPHEV